MLVLGEHCSFAGRGADGGGWRLYLHGACLAPQLDLAPEILSVEEPVDLAALDSALNGEGLDERRGEGRLQRHTSVDDHVGQRSFQVFAGERDGLGGRAFHAQRVAPFDVLHRHPVRLLHADGVGALLSDDRAHAFAVHVQQHLAHKNKKRSEQNA
jgi:hypothetical protein